MQARTNKKPMFWLALVAAVLFVSVTGQAGEFESSGKARMRHEMGTNGLNPAVGGLKGAAQVTYFDLAWSLNYKASDAVSVFFQPKFADMWGNNSGGLTDTTTAFNMHQAYINWMAMDGMNVFMGRQGLAYGDQLVIGTVGWHPIGRTFDTFRVRYAHAMGWVDVFAAKVKENHASSKTPALNTDSDFSGLYAHFSFNDMAKEVDLYYLDNEKPSNKAAGSKDSNTGEIMKPFSTTAFGLRVKGGMPDVGVDWRLEYTSQSHKANTAADKNETASGSQYDLEVGYTLDMGDNKLRIAAEMANADKNYHQLYPTAHKWLGHYDLWDRRNIKDTVIHVKADMGSYFGAALDYHMFAASEKKADIYWWGTTESGGSNNDTEANYGSEIDLTLTYKADANLSWALGYFSFTGSGKLWENVDPKQFSMMHLSATATF